jgi:hypothetical protein
VGAGEYGAQKELAAVTPCDQPVVKHGASVACVLLAGGRRIKEHAVRGGHHNFDNRRQRNEVTQPRLIDGICKECYLYFQEIR